MSPAFLATRPDRTDLIESAGTALNLGMPQMLFAKQDGVSSTSAERRAEALRALQSGGAKVLLNTAGYDIEAVRDAELALACRDFDVMYVGQNVRTARLCMDKGRTRNVLAAAGVRVAAGESHRTAESLTEALSRAKRPSYLKPDIGASGEFNLVVHPGEIFDAAGLPFPVLREDLLSGTEISVDVISDMHGDIAYPPIHKGRLGTVPEHPRSKLKICPYPWSAADHDSILRTAIAAARAVGSTAVANVDLVLHDDGTLTVLEINARFSGSTRMLATATSVNPYELLLAGAVTGHRHSGNIDTERTVLEFPGFTTPPRVPDFARFTPSSARHPWAGSVSLTLVPSTSGPELSRFIEDCGAQRFLGDIMAASEETNQRRRVRA